ncbi:MAG: carbohydrate kinase [Lentisphaerae bacterium]|nr:carbohydrate kinase [Lentisphaerota bacterium]
MSETSGSGLASYIDRFPERAVAVVGDVMLDRYIWGKASRISQEAPVPVVRVERETMAPGGAANVSRNLVSLGARAALFGVIGGDEHGARLCQCLSECGVDTVGITESAEHHTTVKTRVLAGTQQVVRIDRETTQPISASVADELKSRLTQWIRTHEAQVLLLQDYAKGVLTQEFAEELVEIGNSHGLIVAMDPHPGHPFAAPGLRLLTPNRAEAFALAGVYYQPNAPTIHADAPLLGVGARLIEQWGVELLLITLGGKGMALFCRGEEPVHIPTRAREVFDVSGAGDTVVAAFSLALAAGATPVAAAGLANHAAGLVVAKLGTAAVTADELAADLANWP